MDTNSPNSQPADDSVQEVLASLKSMIARDLNLRIEEHEIDPTAPLFEGGLMLDSMVLFELIGLIEKRFGTTFPTEELDSKMFANLTVLSQHVVEMRSRQGQESRAGGTLEHC